MVYSRLSIYSTALKAFSRCLIAFSSPTVKSYVILLLQVKQLRRKSKITRKSALKAEFCETRMPDVV